MLIFGPERFKEFMHMGFLLSVVHFVVDISVNAHESPVYVMLHPHMYMYVAHSGLLPLQE